MVRRVGPWFGLGIRQFIGGNGASGGGGGGYSVYECREQLWNLTTVELFG